MLRPKCILIFSQVANPTNRSRPKRSRFVRQVNNRRISSVHCIFRAVRLM